MSIYLFHSKYKQKKYISHGECDINLQCTLYTRKQAICFVQCLCESAANDTIWNINNLIGGCDVWLWAEGCFLVMSLTVCASWEYEWRRYGIFMDSMNHLYASRRFIVKYSWIHWDRFWKCAHVQCTQRIITIVLMRSHH